MANFSTDWPFHLAAALLALLSAFILYLSLLHNRSRGRRRCPKCWYDMSGADASREKGLVCPECGRDAKRERRLYKIRKRWGWAAIAAALACGSYAAMAGPKLRQDGFLKSVPTTALIVALPWLSPPTADVQSVVIRGDRPPADAPPLEKLSLELMRRVSLDAAPSGIGEEWPRWQRRMLWRRVLGVEREAIRREQGVVYPGFLSHLYAHHSDDELATRVYVEVYAAQAIISRRLWPIDMAPLYSVRQVPTPRIGGPKRVMRVVPQLVGAESVNRDSLSYSQLRRPEYAHLRSFMRADPDIDDGLLGLGAASAERRRVRFHITVADGDVVIWRGSTVRTLEPVQSTDEVMAPVAGGAADDLVRSIPACVVRCESSGRAALLIEPWLRASPLIAGLPDVTLAVQLAIWEGEAPLAAFHTGEGAPRQSVRVWSRIDRASPGSGGAPLHLTSWMYALSPAIDWRHSPENRVLRITGHPETAMRDLRGIKHWSGDVAAPLEVINVPREDFDARFKVGEYLLPGAIDPWADTAAAPD